MIMCVLGQNCLGEKQVTEKFKKRAFKEFICLKPCCQDSQVFSHVGKKNSKSASNFKCFTYVLSYSMVTFVFVHRLVISGFILNTNFPSRFR